MLRVVILGYGELAQSIVLGVLRAKHQVVGVMRWEKQRPNPVSAFFRDFFMPNNLLTIIKSNKIKEINAKNANSEQFIKQIKQLNPDVIIVSSWGEILKQEIIDLPKLACINCHPSLLPKHRGSNPYTSVIMAGETVTGVTFHLMSEKIDAGEILMQAEVPVTLNDTGETLRNKCAFKAKETVRLLLSSLEKGELIPVKQDEEKASYFNALSEDNAIINWEKPAESIHNQIRGLYPWMKCYTAYGKDFLFIGNTEIVSLETPVQEAGKILEKTPDGVLVSTGDPFKAIFAKKLEVYGFLSPLWSKQFVDKHLKIGSFFK